MLIVSVFVRARFVSEDGVNFQSNLKNWKQRTDYVF